MGSGVTTGFMWNGIGLLGCASGASFRVFATVGVTNSA